MKYHRKDFASVMELRSYCREQDLRKHSDDRGFSQSWFGLSGGAKAVDDMFLTGWHEGAERIRQTLKVLTAPKISSVRRKRVRGPIGDEVDMQRVYAGDLARAWSTTTRTPKRGRQIRPVTIVVDISTVWSRTSDEYFWRGAVATRLADELQKAGRAVRIVVAICHDDAFRDGAGFLCSVVVKDFQEPLSLDRVAYQTALAGFYRYYVFAAEEHVAEDNNTRAQAGLGRIVTFLEEEFPNWGENVIIVRGVWHRSDAQIFLDSIAK